MLSIFFLKSNPPFLSSSTKSRTKRTMNIKMAAEIPNLPTCVANLDSCNYNGV